MKINSILIANRGEIACRIIRTANEMGIKTIAVYEEADSNATFVSMSDVAVKLRNGYLDADEIVDAAKKTGADNTCPVTTGIFLRIAIEQNMGDVNFPYWRVIDENHPVVKKLNLDGNQIKNRRIDEGIPH